MLSSHLLSLLLAGAASAGAPSQAPVRLDPAHIAFNLDAAGHASGFVCLSAPSAPTCAAIIRAATRWNYEPGLQDGKPLAMRAWMTLHLQAVPAPGGFALKAVRASIREAGVAADEAAAAMTVYVPPRYPEGSMRRGETGIVELELGIDPGSDHPSIRNAWLNGRKAPRRSELVAAAIVAASAWKMGVHSPKVLSVCVPMEFNLNKPLRPSDPSPCKPSYAEGYKSPVLLTKAGDMVF